LVQRTDNLDDSENTVKPKKPSVQPYVITRDALQAKVIGAGYPSLPVYSVEEFYDQLAGKGMMPEAGHGHCDTLASIANGPVQIGGGVTDKQKDDDKIEKEKLEHDEDELQKQRDWDEWKDDNKRGAGNRYNRS
jgi:immunoglobulin-binding protein 1